MNSFKDKTILLISPEAWGQNFVSKHHYASYLSKNNEVFFLNPVTASKTNPFSDVECRTRRIKDGLTEVSYKNLLPKLNLLPKKIQEKIYSKQARQIQKALKIEKFDIVWSFDPFRFFNQKVWYADHYIYHTVDVHFNKCFEETIAETSDLVLLSSELLRAKLQKSNERIYYVGHASDLDNFEAGIKSPVDLKKDRITAGLVGNFNNKVDYDLIEKIALKNEHIDFIFVGPYNENNLGNDTATVAENIARLSRLKNVRFIGSVPSEDIIKYLAFFDINLVLYREDKRDIIINPHKIMGYLYSGKITICSWFNEYKNAEKELIYMTDKNAEIPDAVFEVSRNLNYWNSPEFVEKRRAFSIKNSYQSKLDYIFRLLYDKEFS